MLEELQGSLSVDDERRRELQRLLRSTNNDERIDMLKKELSLLESSSRGDVGYASHTSNSLFSNRSSSDVANRSRPMSASMRRFSFSNLSAIPENRAIIHRSLTEDDHENDVYICSDDILDICASSYDPKCELRNVFRYDSTPLQPLNWISTGLAPQFISIIFNTRWNFRKLAISCVGVDEVSYSISSSRSIQSVKPDRDGALLLTKKSENVFVASLASETRQGASGDKIVLLFTRTAGPFFSVRSIVISVVKNK